MNESLYVSMLYSVFDKYNFLNSKQFIVYALILPFVISDKYYKYTWSVSATDANPSDPDPDPDPSVVTGIVYK